MANIVPSHIISLFYMQGNAQLPLLHFTRRCQNNLKASKLKQTMNEKKFL